MSAPLDQDHDEFLKNQDAINLIVHDSVARFNGWVSAEHGFGTLRALKQALDPQGIMNPNKVLASLVTLRKLNRVS